MQTHIESLPQDVLKQLSLTQRLRNLDVYVMCLHSVAKNYNGFRVMFTDFLVGISVGIFFLFSRKKNFCYNFLMQRNSKSI